MLGPVYALEWLQSSRRVQKYPWRWMFAGILLLEAQWLTVVAVEAFFVGSTSRAVVVADNLLRFLIAQQTLAILLLTPAFACGSITDEKRRGTLDYLLLSPLSSAEIILGKWLGQATQVFHLISPGYFLVAILAAIIGTPIKPLLLAIAIQFALIYSVTALSLLLSTWSRSTTKAIIGFYLFFGLVVFVEATWDLGLIGPLLWGYVATGPEATLGQHFRGLGGLMLLTIVALGWSIGRLRFAHQQQHSAGMRVLSRWWDRPPVSAAPMRWKERFIGEWFSVPIWRVLPRWLKCVTLAALVAGLAVALPDPETFVALGAAQFLLSGLFVAIRSAGAVTVERENQTWDSLLTTHMDAYQIVRGKLWGQIDALIPYLLAYLLPAMLMAYFTSFWGMMWVLYTWLASWIFLYYLGAVGISCSVKSTSTWRSILSTLAIGSYSLAFNSIFFGILGGGIAIIGVFLTFAPGLSGAMVATICTALGSLPGLAWIFAQTEEVLQKAQQELKRQKASVEA